MAFSGTYHGLVRFRSLLELSLIVWLESQGLVLGSTMLYEATRITYGRTRKRTYVVDLTLPQTRRLIEVKPLSRTRGRRNVAKRLAAEEWCLANGWSYSFVTDQDLMDWGCLLTLREAASIPGIEWGDKASRRINGRKRRKAMR